MADKKVTLKQAVEQVLSELNESIKVTDLADRVYALYPTRSKTAMSSLRNCLHYDEQGVNLVYLDRVTVLPMRIAMQRRKMKYLLCFLTTLLTDMENRKIFAL
jgi:hypothetical protein